jgi:hypothetical protein
MTVVVDDEVVARVEGGLAQAAGMIVGPVVNSVGGSLGRDIPRIQFPGIVRSDGADGAVLSFSLPDGAVDLEGVNVFLAFGGSVSAEV